MIAWEADEADRFRRVFAALVAIPDGHPGDAGTIACPSCNAPLHYHYPRGAIRLRAHCETPGCVGVLDKAGGQ